MTTTTTTQVRIASLVSRFPISRSHKKKKYRLVYNYSEEKYNDGMRFDIESGAFKEPRTSMVIRNLARSLADVSKAVVRVVCFEKGSKAKFSPFGLTTGFYVDAYHILTTADIMEDEEGQLLNHEKLLFAYSPRVVTDDWDLVVPSLLDATFVHQTDHLLLLRVSPPTLSVPHVLPNEEFMKTTVFDPRNEDPDYINATSVCVVGYSEGITLSQAKDAYNGLPDEIRNVTPAPAEEDVRRLPHEHKSLFYGRIIYFVEGCPDQFCITASLFQGACGSPVFCPADPTKFIGIVLGGAETANFNMILTTLSPEFNQILATRKLIINNLTCFK